MRFRKVLPVVLLAIVGSVGYSAYAFTAANTVPDSNAGEGTSTVSGYTITAVDYDLNNTDPSDIDAVDLTLSPAPTATGEVFLKLNSQLYSCTVAGAVATCATTSPQATVSPTTSLDVIAAD